MLNGLLETPPDEIGQTDIAALNLLCAPNLPGSEGLDIPDCLARLKRLTEYVGIVTERNLCRFPNDPDYGHCEPMWRMSALVTAVKRSYGVRYNPEVIASQAGGPIGSRKPDSRDSFIDGLLGADLDRRT